MRHVILRFDLARGCQARGDKKTVSQARKTLFHKFQTHISREDIIVAEEDLKLGLPAESKKVKFLLCPLMKF